MTSRKQIFKEDSLIKKIRGHGLNKQTIHLFQKLIYGHSQQNGRNMAWRQTHNPYRILVSEIMLQQTQVERVRERYPQFIAACPDFPSLAKASTHSILKVWQGMGYNRRALALKEIANRVISTHKGKLPHTFDELIQFPCIGRSTAGAILAFAFQIPVPFIETNIRRVFLHFFFQDKKQVTDAEILPLVDKTLDKKDPRQWYYALMDYGVALKKTYDNPNKRSAHYKKQSLFENSNRQMRGRILKTVVSRKKILKPELFQLLDLSLERGENILANLERDGFLSCTGAHIRIK